MQQVVECYLQHDASRSREELAYFGNRQQTLEHAIQRACRSAFDDGKIHPHQRRIGHQKCAVIAEELLPHARAIQTCRDFDTLLRRVAMALGHIFQNGELTAYDVAQRIGHYLGVEPDRVYLHRGVRDGARALLPNLPPGQQTLWVSDLPSEFRCLTAAQCEDLLCIYKTDLRRIMAGASRYGATN